MEISILVMTYNHEEFVKQALDSIIMQKINVSYEILILDDASTDNTAKILREYKEKYPQKIKLYLRKVNSGHPTKNVYFLLSKAKGNFYTFLEGDDYWIDSMKIQMQYEFLKKHKKYSGCMTDLIVVDEENNEIKEQVYERKENSVYTLEDFKCLKAVGMTATFFARNYFDEEDYRILFKADKMMGDITSYMLCLLKGNIYQLDKVTAAYRYVCTVGKENFNSIHQGNIYRNYMTMRYWIRLENYMKKYDEKFEFIPMANIIAQVASQYSVKSVLDLIMQSKNRKKYMLIYFINKFMLDSDFLLKNVGGQKRQRQYDWNDFKKNKKPIILFGAGAVAAEYLDKYAWKDNILFLVDNNKNKQNTSYKGFLIKSPNEIIKYKDKATLLIVNKNNEREIETQIHGLEIQSYYCYCSMQSRRPKNIFAGKLLEYYSK